MYKIINLLTKILEKGLFFSLSLLVINTLSDNNLYALISNHIEGELQRGMVSIEAYNIFQLMIMPQFRVRVPLILYIPLCHTSCSFYMHGLRAQRTEVVKYIHEAMALFGVEAKLLFTLHNWPRWGGADLIGFLDEVERSLPVDTWPDHATFI